MTIYCPDWVRADYRLSSEPLRSSASYYGGDSHAMCILSLQHCTLTSLLCPRHIMAYYLYVNWFPSRDKAGRRRGARGAKKDVWERDFPTDSRSQTCHSENEKMRMRISALPGITRELEQPILWYSESKPAASPPVQFAGVQEQCDSDGVCVTVIGPQSGRTVTSWMELVCTASW